MSELVFDQEWMAILEAMGSLPLIHTISLSFRVSVPIPIQAFTALIKLTASSSLETLNLSGLQLSTAKIPSHSTTNKPTKALPQADHDGDPVNELMEASRQHQSLKTVYVSRYRPFRSTAATTLLIEDAAQSTADPLFRALLQLPHLRMLHIEKTDIFSDPALLGMICRTSPMPTLKIGDLDRKIRLERYLPSMGEYLEGNHKLQELVVHHTLKSEKDGNLAAVAQLLRDNTSLCSVSLRINSNDFGTHLATALGGNTSLQSLTLDLMADRRVFRNNLKVMTAAWGDNHNTALKKLKVDARVIRSPAILQDSLGKMLRDDNFVLEHLHINRGTMPLSQDVLFYLKLNKLGRNRFLRRQQRCGTSDEVPLELGLIAIHKSNGHDFRGEWVQMLIENKGDLRLLHYFISRNPLILTST